MDLQEVLKRLKEGKRAGGMAFKIFDGVAYVSRNEVEKFEKDYWESEQELKACRECIQEKNEALQNCWKQIRELKAGNE